MRKQIIITAELEVLEGDDIHADAKALDSKIYEMLVDRDFLNQKQRNPSVSHIISNVPETTM